MKTAIKLSGLLALATTVLFGLGWIGFRNVEETKEAAPKVWADSGYEIIGYEGYQWGPIRGGNVWYIVRRKGNDSVTYHGYITPWFGEYHIYNLRAIDVIKPE